MNIQVESNFKEPHKEDTKEYSLSLDAIGVIITRLSMFHQNIKMKCVCQTIFFKSLISLNSFFF